MSRVFRPTDVSEGDREDYWHEVVTRSVVPMHVRLDEGPTARDEIVVGRLGAVEVVAARSGPGEGRRTLRHIRASDPGIYQLLVQLDGGTTEQAGHQVELVPGDISLTDPSRPFHCVHPTRSVLLLRFPRTLMPLPEREVAAVVGMRIPGEGGTGALVSALARQLPRHLDTPRGARLGSAILDLMTVALGERLDRRVPGEAHQHTLLVRIQAFIESRLPHTDLTPASIAAAHHISVRYLHKLFLGEHTTVADHIRRRRLERCSRDLLDPALADKPVIAIARRWGFGNPAHFTRVFRDAYGMPPSEYRRTALLFTRRANRCVPVVE
jgi:AraC-like DNA-binding protein